ncbi:aromatic-ring-hydroxylating dioxygenase subunit beta [Telmatospirillum sp. J64-1]|uniref:aromatic-ring-hydroxylating dioxygenase subunit beta n=1 Tax=Telmatospirillum sp. J64-1 TaxID=2502183 RepID=UPI00115C8EA3|nr:aromatic-ring-hydroxylating dioxygenase subunit beta [Telmatospirillum sp. J64-1]
MTMVETKAAPVTRDAVEELLFLEADLLDRRQWDEWLSLYTPDAVFWVPSWRNEDQTVENPELELNLIYINGRGGLEDRVFRFDSGDSYASLPLPATSHVVGSVRLLRQTDEQVEAGAKWIVATMSHRRGTQIRSGWYDYVLRRTEHGLRIARKKVTLLETAIDGTIDVYNL